MKLNINISPFTQMEIDLSKEVDVNLLKSKFEVAKTIIELKNEVFAEPKELEKPSIAGYQQPQAPQHYAPRLASPKQISWAQSLGGHHFTANSLSSEVSAFIKMKTGRA